MFHLKTELHASKSFINRVLILLAQDTSLKFNYSSQASDVTCLREAITNFKNGESSFNLGDGGTSFRFFTIFLSAQVGNFKIKLSKELRTRPHQDLELFFEQQGIAYQWSTNTLEFKTKGWTVSSVKIEANKTTQYLTAIALMSLSQGEINISTNKRNSDFFKMTSKLLQSLGAQVNTSESEVSILPWSIKTKTINAETDMASAFSILCFGVLYGFVELQNFTKNSIQPDVNFLQIFKALNINYSFISNYDNSSSKAVSQNCINNSINGKNKQDHNTLKKDLLRVEKQNFDGAVINLKSCPDLFCSLVVLCLFADSPSTLVGLDDLNYKESPRLEVMTRFLKATGAEFYLSKNQIVVHPLKNTNRVDITGFSTYKDHRVAMAYALYDLSQRNSIQNPDCVKKSFPKFWQLLDFGVQ